MSPLSRLLLRLLLYGCWGAGILVVLFTGILVYQRVETAGFSLHRGDLSLLIILAVLFVMAVYLVRGISSELDKTGG